MPNTITFQQIVIEGRRDVFTEKVNALLMDGWRVVPGTYATHTVEKVADSLTPPHLVTPAGTVFLPFFFIAIERTEVAADPTANGYGEVDQALAFQPMRK